MFSSLRERVLTRTRVNKEVYLFFREKKTRGFLGEHIYISSKLSFCCLKVVCAGIYFDLKN